MQLNFNSKKSPKEKNSKKELSSNQSSQEKPLSNITPQGLQTDTQNPLGTTKCHRKFSNIIYN